MTDQERWQRFLRYVCVPPNLGLRLDVSGIHFDDAWLEQMAQPMAEALAAMDRLEQGAIANPDEQRMVGHYWLRAPQLAPHQEIRDQISKSLLDVKKFATDIHLGTLCPEREDAFFVVLVVGIGGSALGPQFIGDALGTPDDPMMLRFIDNTDPEGMDRMLAELDESLSQTLTVVISKSGSTVETRNGMLEVAAAYERAGLRFARHAVAVTCENSPLFRKAVQENWLRVFPIWEWVGGRTSVLSAAGLLPIALQGIDVDDLLTGARECDAATRKVTILDNPAALMALMWHAAGGGRGRRNLVVLPYRDRLALLGRYLQQLVMESLGKASDREGNPARQGLTVYGNKGSTDQHAYIQQLRDGPDDCFVTFLEILNDRAVPSLLVEENVTTGDFLHAFLHGTRSALTASGRQSLTVTFEKLNARALGILIALFERTVGLYAELINVNAYHQPGVEAGKQAAGAIINLQRQVLAYLRSRPGKSASVEEVARAIERPDAIQMVFHVLEQLAANQDHGVQNPSGMSLDPRELRVSASKGL